MVEAGTSEIFTQDFRSSFYCWGEASALYSDLVAISLLVDASPVQRVDLARGDRFEVLDDRPKRARLRPDWALGQTSATNIKGSS